MRRLLALLALVVPQLAAGAPDAATCRDEVFEDASFTLCEVARGEDLRLFLNGSDGPYGSFSAVNEALDAEGATLAFAMNAGMFHSDLSPVGLFIQAGRELARLVTRRGPGNFGMLPNGVFCWGADGFRLIESRRYKAAPPACDWATQSGPMLVLDGQLHPDLRPDGESTLVRNGVGVTADGSRAVFAISNDAVNFHTFARLFRDHLHLPDALFLDGSVSRLYAPELGRSDLGFPMGPIIGAVIPKG